MTDWSPHLTIRSFRRRVVSREGRRGRGESVRGSDAEADEEEEEVALIGAQAQPEQVQGTE